MMEEVEEIKACKKTLFVAKSARVNYVLDEPRNSEHDVVGERVLSLDGGSREGEEAMVNMHALVSI